MDQTPHGSNFPYAYVCQCKKEHKDGNNYTTRIIKVLRQRKEKGMTNLLFRSTKLTETRYIHLVAFLNQKLTSSTIHMPLGSKVIIYTKREINIGTIKTFSIPQSVEHIGRQFKEPSLVNMSRIQPPPGMTRLSDCYFRH